MRRILLSGLLTASAPSLLQAERIQVTNSFFHLGAQGAPKPPTYSPHGELP